MREQDQQLLDFCNAQYHQFNQADWLKHAQQDHFIIAAMLLSNSAWYKKSQELNWLCDNCGWSKANLPGLVKATHFDCARFMSMLKTKLVML